MSFNGAILRHAGEPLAIERLEHRALEPDEVRVRLHAAGVCHTDFEAATGAFAAPMPTVPGHEGAGIVEAVGSAVRTLAVGDAVVCSIYPACGGCFYCRRTLPMLCEALPGSRSQRTPPLRTTAGETVLPFLNTSTFAEYCVVPERGAIRIPREMPLDRACLLGCAVLTGVGAVLRIANVEHGDSVAVVGCGAVGLNAIQGAVLAGAELIVAIDLDDTRLAAATTFGATHALRADDPSLADTVRSLTAGRGVDHGIECAGVIHSLQTTLDCTRPGASVTILGKTDPSRDVPLRFGSLSAERRIRRSSLGGARAADDIPMLARAYLDGRLKLDEQIDHRLPLAEVNHAFELLAKGATVRTVLEIIR